MSKYKIEYYKKHLQDIKNHIITPNLGIKSVISSISVFLIMIFAPRFVWLSPIVIIFTFSALSIETKPDKINALKHIKKAKKYLDKDDLRNFTKELISAYTYTPIPQLDKLIKELAPQYDLKDYYEQKTLEVKAKLTNDKNLKDILNELIKVQNYILEHTKQLEKLNKKLSSLYNELYEAPDTYKTEIQNLINRYKNIIKLEESKIQFYIDLKNELNRLYNEHIYREKLQNEYKFIEQIEEQVLTNSIAENYTTDNNKDFIDFQRIYLQQLSDLAQQANSTANQEIFDNIRKDFEQKRKDLNS